MVLAFDDRVHETTTTTGTGTLNLAGAATGAQTFVAGVGNANTCYYVIYDGASAWETGIGTVTDGSPDTLSRDTVLASSNGDALVNFGAGTKDVRLTVLGSRGFPFIKDADGDTGWDTERAADDDNLYGKTAGTDRLILDELGHVTKPTQSSFAARVGATVTNVTGDGTAYTVAAGSEEWDLNADYNTGTYTFTAPVAGRYLFTAGVSLDDVAGAHTSGDVHITASGDAWWQNLLDVGNVYNPNGNIYLNVSQIVNMAANDTATLVVQVSNGAKVVDVLGAAYPYTWWSGELLG